MINLAHLKWSESHGANPIHAGCGVLYYSLPYMMKSKKCVCLGSGGGFVPAYMVEAQKTLVNENILSSIDVTLVDANIGPWGLPIYQNESYFNKIGYPEIKLLVDTTKNAASTFNNIDYLHIDADHSYQGVLEDLNDYKDKMSSKSIITLHDTNNSVVCGGVKLGVWKAIKDFIADNPKYSVINFNIGAGTAILGTMNGACLE